LGAQVMVAEDKGCSCCGALIHSAFGFFKTYLLKLGILDGWRGLAIAFSNAVGVFYRYMKCVEMKERQD